MFLKKILRFVLEFIQSIVLALSVFVLLYFFVMQPNEVKGSSMLPNFEDGEFLLTDKITYQFKRDPARGDVVVFKAPPSEPCAADECEYIKRVIGLPGDTVMVKNNSVYLNGEILIEDFLPNSFVTEPPSILREGRVAVIPLCEYLLLGDNRSHSRDGREFGPVPRESIVGRAFFKYWPVSSLGLIEKVSF